MDTKKLRQKILDLAIHGKLVPQDPNDEPASVLLERIRAEKEQLIKEGKIKAPKKGKSAGDTSHYGKEGPWALPEGWVWCRLEDIAYVAAGSTPDKSCFVPEGIPYIKMYNVRNQQIDFDYSPQYIIPSVHYGKLQRSILYPGDLLMNIVGPPLGKLAIIPDSLPESNTNQAAVLIRPFLYKGLINKYLFYYLEEMTEINSIATKGSAGQVNISLTQSQLMRIPLPPLEEQRKIVESIEKWIGLVDNIANGVKSILDNIENAKAKILELAIHGKLIPQDPSDEPAIELLRRINPAFKPSDNLHYLVDLPSGWTCGLFGELNQRRNKSEDPISSPEQEYELYSVPTYETGMPEYLHGKEIGSTKQLVDKGDVLLCKINPHLNRAWVVSHHRPELQCIASSEWIVFHSNAMIPEYARLFFMSPHFKNLMLSNVSGVGGSLMRAQPHAVKTYPIWIPPIEEQKRIVKMVTSLFAELQQITDFIES